MPTRNQSGKPEHTHQNPNRKRKKSGKKYEKLFQHCRMLKRREERDGMTAWLANAWEKVERKMKKYSITQAMVDNHLNK